MQHQLRQTEHLVYKYTWKGWPSQVIFSQLWSFASFQEGTDSKRANRHLTIRLFFSVVFPGWV